MPASDRQDRLHVGALPVQVDGNDGLGAGRDQVFDPRRIDVEVLRLDVDKHRLGPQSPGGAGRGEEGVAGHQHFVALAYVAGHQRQQKRVAARGATHRVRGLTIGRQLLLQQFDFGAENVMARSADA